MKYGNNIKTYIEFAENQIRKSFNPLNIRDYTQRINRLKQFKEI